MLRSHSLKIKLIIISILLAAVPVLMVGIISYNRTYDTLKKSTINYVNRASEQLANNTDLSINEIRRFMELGSNKATTEFLLSKNRDERTEHAHALIEMIKLYRSMYRFNNSVINTKIIGVEDLNFDEKIGVYSMTKEERNQYIERFNNNRGSMVIDTQGAKDEILAGEEDQLSIVAGVPIYQTATNDLLGVLLLELDAEPFLYFTSNEKIGEEGFYSIIDTNHVILTSEDKQNQIEFNENDMDYMFEHKNGTFSKTIDGKEVIVIFSTMNTYDWKVVGTAYMDDLMKEAKYLGKMIAMILFASIIFIVSVNTIALSKLFVPLDRLRKRMILVALGEMEMKVLKKPTDEIEQLDYTFSEMLLQIQELMNRNHLEQEKLRMAQLRILQEQINPHFLYNTLDNIIWLASNKEYHKIIQTTDALSNFFRISLSNGREFITVAQEIQHIHNYLVIQENRYSEILNYSIDVDANVMDCMIMKLLLQPLVENAIYHGIKQKRSAGCINVRGWLQEGDIIFQVNDDGIGIPANKLNELSHRLNTESPLSEDYDDGYGLFNINSRVKLYYGSNYGLQFDSRLHCGTTVTLKIKREGLHEI